MSKRPVPTSLLQQNCYLLDATVSSSVSASTAAKKTYTSLDEVTDVTGVKLVQTENDYPITPEYVDSFSESSDYRNDVVGAISSAPKRRNLGDITEFQNVASMDMESARALYKQLQDKFAKAQAQSQQQPQPSAPAPDSSKSEV